MNEGRTVFAQLLDHLPRHQFQLCVSRYAADYKLRRFSCWDQFLCLAFAQLTQRESLRDTTACLTALGSRRYHLGMRGPISRSTLADANEKRDWRVYADFAQILIAQARQLYQGEPLAVDLQQTVYAFDSTSIDLCLKLCPWAPYKGTKGALKLHTLLDLRGSIPTVVHLTSGKVADVSTLAQLTPQPGAYYVMDRGYLDFAQLYRFQQAAAFFVVRGRNNLRLRRRYSTAVEPTSGLRSDQTVLLSGKRTDTKYPAPLRRIRYFDAEQGRALLLLTNNFFLPPLTITQLYRSRWLIELFFRWIKQHLRIRRFFGYSQNAVATQIWIAVIVYVLAAIARKRLASSLSLYSFLQILSLTLLDKTPIHELFPSPTSHLSSLHSPKQLILLDF